jgi:serpin B
MTDQDGDWLSRSLQRATVQRAGHALGTSGPGRGAARLSRRRRSSIAAAVTLLVIAGGTLFAEQATSRTLVATTTTAPVTSAAGHRVVAGPDGSLELVADVGRQPVAPGGADEGAVIRSEQAFTLALTQRISALSPARNVVLSGASVALALSMLELGARGSTAAQIAAVLGTSQLSAAQQASGWDALTSQLTGEAAAGHSLLAIADSIWEQRGFNVDGPFLDNLGKYFSSSLWQADFASDPAAATTAVNAWVDKATAGRIPQLFPPGVLGAATKLVLVNAIHFKSAWAHPFAEGADAPFHLTAGGTVSVPMMTLSLQSSLVPVLQDKGATAVELPYAGASFAALVIEPSGSLPGYLTSLTPAALAAIVRGLRPETGSLTMPPFKLTSQTNLSALLAAMGMPLAFEADGADFADISPVPLYVSSVEHAAYLDVDEWGTEAAAATGVGMTDSAISAGPRFDITIDHPFLFLIRDTRSGAILFSSVVNDPTS